MVGRYQGLGLQVLYPDSWTLEEVGGTGEAAGINIESPGGMFFSVNRYENFSDSDALIEQAIDAMRKEYPDLEEDPVENENEWQTDQAIELSFYCMDLLVTARIFAILHETDTLLVHVQGESRDFDRLESVFLGMMKSLRDSLNPNAQ